MRVSAGLMVPNPTFSIPDEVGTGAALWSLNGAAATTLSGIAGPLGRRAQRITRTATGTREYASGYGVRPYPVGHASSTFLYATVWWRSSDGGVGDSWTLYLVMYDDDGAELADESLLTESGASASSTWEVSRASIGITSFAAQQPVYLGLRFDFAGAATWDFAFVGIGMAVDGATPGYYAPTALPIHTPGAGSFGMPLSDSPMAQTARGQAMAVDGDRLGNPYRLQIGLETVSATERLALARYWQANHNGLFVPSTTTVAGVQGGEYPLLVDHQLSDSTIPPVMYADWEGEFSINPWALDWQGADPYFDAQMSFRERIYR